ncbi:tail assembly protein [Pseudomonas fluorescens]|uniref:tail assembly protein n=1 Tax=Pseudomonas fluorescens TaxID=294 RepID=UPI000F49767B|nr:tail assembly protein [Pseudomonas fluorescens]RON86743.1 phage tail protein [Pseudomonas fluorescens]
MAMAAYQDKIQDVWLSGALARAAGGRHHRMITNGGLKDMMGYFRQFPGFAKYLAESASKGIRFAVFVGPRNLAEDQLADPTGKDVIRIIPVLAGSKRAGSLQTIVGAALVVIGGVVTAFGGGAIGLPMMKIGAAIAIGGVIQMLSPQTKGLASQDGPNNKASYSFNGPVNTSAQGNPVPVLYGEMIVGSAVISAGIYAEDQQ